MILSRKVLYGSKTNGEALINNLNSLCNLGKYISGFLNFNNLKNATAGFCLK